MEELDQFSQFDRMLAESRNRSNSVPVPPPSVQDIQVEFEIEVEFEEEDDEDNDPNKDERDLGIKWIENGSYFDPSLPYEPQFITKHHRKLGDILEEIHPGRWSVSGEYFKILFPQITIVNSHRRSHTLRDLFVRFGIREDGQGLIGLEGCRGILTRAEIYSDYSHSHLSGLDGGSFSNFCLGSDYIIDCIRSMQSFRDPLYLKKFEGFLHQLKEYLSYESLETTPFRKIETVGERSTTNHLDSRMREHGVADVFWYFKQCGFVPEFNIDAAQGQVTIVDTEQYEDLLLLATAHRNVGQMRDRFGLYFMPSEGLSTDDGSGATNYIKNCSQISFRNQQFSPKIFIENETQSIEISTKKYCHREIKDQFEREFKFKILKHWAKLSERILANDFIEHCQRRESQSLKRFSPQSIQIVSEDLGD